MKKTILLLIGAWLMGCSTLKTIVEPVQKIPLALEDPTPMELGDVEFIVIHKDNAEKVFFDLQKKGMEPVLFALSGADYKMLSVNVAEIKSYLKLQKKILILYRNYYEPKEN